jgi:hypothetical protein
MHDITDLVTMMTTTPDLPGAACVDERATFDAVLEDATDVGRAVRICARCPALAACSRWVASLPPLQRPGGVTGGLIRRTG